jgi:pimeloyl-ACP methyl ester carboxylesterase
MAERLRAELPAARLVEIQDAYHHLVLDQPDAFAHELLGFLAGLDGSGMGAEASASGRPAVS